MNRRMILGAIRKLLASDRGISDVIEGVLNSGYFDIIQQEISDRQAKIDFLENDLETAQDELEGDDLKKAENEINSKIDKAQKEIDSINENIKGVNQLISSKWFDNIAEMVAYSVQKNRSKGGVSLTKEDVDDMLIDYAMELMDSGLDLWLKVFSKHEKDNYTTVTQKDWQKIFKYHTSNKIKNIAQKYLNSRYKEHGFGIKDTGEGDVSQEDLFESDPTDVNPLEKEEIEGMKRDLADWVKREDLSNGILSMMFNIWFKNLDASNSEKIFNKIKKDKKINSLKILKGKNKGKPYSESALRHNFDYLKYVIIMYFIKDRKMDLNKADLKQLNVSGNVEKKVMASSELKEKRMLIATYVLSGVDVSKYAKHCL